MDRLIKTTRHRFTIICMGVAVLCASIAGLSVYAVAEWQLTQKRSSGEIYRLAAANDPVVNEYLQSQASYSPHFEKLATIIQNDQRAQLKRVLPIIMTISAFLGGLMGWLLARRLLSPIKETYLSQRRFMQDAAHELRNPLAAMRSLIQHARSSRGPVSAGILTSLDRQARHLSEITTDLLLLERREQPSRKPTDVALLLQDILEELYSQSSRQKITIKTSIPDSLIAQIEPHHFVHIAKNVIENAIKYSGEAKNKHIDVNLTQKSKGWKLEVKDQGIGIAKEDIPMVTERFYRGSNAGPAEGSGLGMAIVNKFVNLYGGKLEIASAVGRGTTVRINI